MTPLLKKTLGNFKNIFKPKENKITETPIIEPFQLSATTCLIVKTRKVIDLTQIFEPIDVFFERHDNFGLSYDDMDALMILLPIQCPEICTLLYPDFEPGKKLPYTEPWEDDGHFDDYDECVECVWNQAENCMYYCFNHRGCNECHDDFICQFCNEEYGDDIDKISHSNDGYNIRDKLEHVNVDSDHCYYCDPEAGYYCEEHADDMVIDPLEFDNLDNHKKNPDALVEDDIIIPDDHIDKIMRDDPIVESVDISKTSTSKSQSFVDDFINYDSFTNYSSDSIDYSVYSGMFGDGISLDESGNNQYSGETHTTHDSLDRNQIIHKPRWVKKGDNNKNLMRSGPKQRGAMRCNQQPKKSRKRKHDEKTIASLRAKKRRDKIEEGGVWKKHGSTRGAEQDALLSNAFAEMRDQEFADKEAKIEMLEVEYDNLMMPNINSEFYENAYKEREYYLKNIEDEKKKKDKKTYQKQEINVNLHLKEYLDEWKLSDYFSFARTSSIVDDLSVVEKFIKDNIDNDELVKSTVNAIGEEVNRKPNLADKCSKFLQDLIMKIKPIALAFDSVHDIKLGVDVLKEEFEVELKDAIPYDLLSDEYGNHMTDVRDDHARRGDMIHRDPLLRHFSIKRIDRTKIIPQQVDYDGIISAELLFQLLAPSVVSIGASEEVVLSKMQHLAGNIHTINLPKFAIIKYGTNIVEDTLLVARAIFKTRRRVSTALGFPVSPQ